MTNSDIDSELLTPREAAIYCGVSLRSIWRWVKACKVGTVRLPDGRHRIVKASLTTDVSGDSQGAD